MSKEREALKLALEALEVLGWQPTEEAMDYRDNAITAIKEALAQQDSVQAKPEPEQDNGKTAPPKGWGEVSREKLIKREFEMLKRIEKAELTLDGLTPTEFALRELYEFQEATGCDTAAEFKTKPEQKPVAFPRNVQEYDEDWIIDPAFISRVKHSIDPETPWDFTPTMEQVEATLLALEVIPASLFTTQPYRKPLLASDIVMMYDENPRSDSEMIAFARAIEAAHGIKGEQ